MNKLKLFFSVIAVTVMLAVMPSVAFAEVQQKTYTISSHGEICRFIVSPEDVTGWEFPHLLPGELTTGKIILKNTADTVVNIALEPIELPYEDEDALRYLMSVQLTIKEGSKVVYSGPYAEIMNSASPVIKINGMPVDSSVEYDITVAADFSYAGNTDVLTEMGAWEFSAVTLVPSDGEEGMPVGTMLLIAAVVIVISAAGAAAIILVRRYKLG